MRKLILAFVAVPSIAVATVTTPTSAEARCRGCWVGAGVAAGVIAGAAIANAAYHATGKRVRDLPITLDKLQR